LEREISGEGKERARGTEGEMKGRESWKGRE